MSAILTQVNISRANCQPKELEPKPLPIVLVPLLATCKKARQTALQASRELGLYSPLITDDD
jgi:hypothetical protein